MTPDNAEDRSIAIAEFLELAHTRAVIDVRSPSEFARGHIQDAVNVPLFSDEQRAQVGTTYKQVGREAAIRLGYEFATPKREAFLQQARQLAPDGQLLVHCWRGGLRSREFANLLAENGMQPLTLQGGYKAFRREVHRVLALPKPLVILAGFTGSGKTQLLHGLAQHGEQVLDLEALAHHRGSTFGGLGQLPQPTVEQFENKLYDAWNQLDSNRLIWAEGESRAIGKAMIPQQLWQQLIDAPEIFLEVPRNARVEFLVGEYGDFKTEDLETALRRIKKRLGGDRLEAALQALQQNDLGLVANIVLDYYDKCYGHASQTHSRRQATHFHAQQAGDLTRLDELKTLGHSLTIGPKPLLQ